jgi:hypothetical protein
MQRRKRGGKESKTDEYEMMRSPSPGGEPAGRQSAMMQDLSNPNMIPLEPRTDLQRQKDELKMLKDLLKKDKKKDKKSKKKKEGKVGPACGKRWGVFHLSSFKEQWQRYGCLLRIFRCALALLHSISFRVPARVYSLGLSDLVSAWPGQKVQEKQGEEEKEVEIVELELVLRLGRWWMRAGGRETETETDR